MKITLNEKKLKQEYAYLNAADLQHDLKEAAYYLAHHNKNLTKQQDYEAEKLELFINALAFEEEV